MPSSESRQVQSQGRSMAFKFVGLIVILKIGAGFIEDIFASIGSIIANFTTPNTGDDTADSIIQALGILLTVVLAFAVYDRFDETTGR